MRVELFAEGCRWAVVGRSFVRIGLLSGFRWRFLNNLKPDVKGGEQSDALS